MFNLIKNEWMKIFKRVGTYVMIGLILIIVAGSGAFTKYAESVSDNEPAGQQDWKKELQTQIEMDKQTLKEVPEINKSMYERSIAVNEYRIENNLPPNAEGENVWSFVEFNSNFVTFAGLFTIIVAASIVASEFTWGTIKLLLIRPISRTKILLSKYLTVLLFGITLLVILFGFSTLLGFILFGGGENVPHLVYVDGQVEEKNLVTYLINTYLLKSIDIIMMATMAFMISAVFRSSSLAIGISLFLLFMGGTATGFIAMKYDWAKYSLFANTDLTQYTGSMDPLIDGMTMGFSITMLLIYFIIFILLAFVIFNKRDVAA
ncbi:ABC-2 type transport system permease protein [Bacillus pakistanensis]|uniref:ABC-2 type transport system permease protein n=1 Tax=Rossellomorea pakistanensis TaxID=992288 RepID=A0ABS2NAB4_9BACI|nr:ABC transporter permease [Bacillus pakistanensis]MBM7584793.1 ABC-2 type transport system permease protein [Bacillus pakistanensis]